MIIDKEPLHQAMRKWGAVAQLHQLQEECAELIVGVSHYLRHNNPEEMINELADVTIMLEQIKLIVDTVHLDRLIEYKIQRLKDRIDGIPDNPGCPAL